MKAQLDTQRTAMEAKMDTQRTAMGAHTARVIVSVGYIRRYVGWCGPMLHQYDCPM
jgi:hypothetical protein